MSVYEVDFAGISAAGFIERISEIPVICSLLLKTAMLAALKFSGRDHVSFILLTAVFFAEIELTTGFC